MGPAVTPPKPGSAIAVHRVLVECKETFFLTVVSAHPTNYNVGFIYPRYRAARLTGHRDYHTALVVSS